MYQFLSNRQVLALTAAVHLLFSPGIRAEEFTGWQTGDVVFHRATCAGWSPGTCDPQTGILHAGIVRMTGGGPHVIEASGRDDVFEIPVEDFISFGRGGAYGVLRLAGLDEDNRHLVPDRAWDFIHAPFDRRYESSLTAFYAAELIAVAFSAIGIELGSSSNLHDLTTSSVSPSAFISNGAPECTNVGDDCPARVEGKRVTTLESVIADPRFRLVHLSAPELIR